MGEQPEENRTPGLPGSKAELLERIQRSRSALEKALENLSEAELATPGPEGWSVKDHLAHLAVWELGVAELLQNRPRFAAMQVEEAVTQGKSEDEINDQIYWLHANLSLAEVMDKFRTTHQQMLDALDQLNDDDLFKPYASYVPESSKARQDPVILWIMGNTYEHFDEHNGYIAQILQNMAR